MTRLLPTVVQLDEDMVRVLDETAAGLCVSRSELVRRYLEEPLRARCLWPVQPPGGQPASSENDDTVHPPHATAAAGSSSRSEQAATSIAPACEPDAEPPTTPTQAGAVPDEQRRYPRSHPFNRRVTARRDPSLRGRDGAPK